MTSDFKCECSRFDISDFDSNAHLPDCPFTKVKHLEAELAKAKQELTNERCITEQLGRSSGHLTSLLVRASDPGNFAGEQWQRLQQDIKSHLKGVEGEAKGKAEKGEGE